MIDLEEFVGENVALQLAHAAYIVAHDERGFVPVMDPGGETGPAAPLKMPVLHGKLMKGKTGNFTIHIRNLGTTQRSIVYALRPEDIVHVVKLADIEIVAPSIGRA